MIKILVMNFFPAFTPPQSGGELRYFNIYKNLSEYYDITLLSPTYHGVREELIEHSRTFREHRIPREDLHNQIHWDLEKENFAPEFSALTCAYSGEVLNNYHKKYLELYADKDMIIHDSPYMLHYDLFFGIDNKARIYHSYNLEFELLSQIYYGNNAKKHLDYIFKLEKLLCEKADMVFTTSEDERNKFHSIYDINLSKINLSPNGINPDDFLKRDDKIKRKTAFFIGSGHPPNIEAVNFIINELAENCKDIEFLIAGNCCNGFETDKLNVKLLGKVDESEKNELFKTSDIAINPMFSGAGTNLKTLEYLSMGIPMVSTDVGVRGIDIKDSEHFILAKKDNFADKLNYIVEDKDLKTKISKKSKAYINKSFDWKNIANNVFTELSKIKKDNNKKTILLLNDFPVSSPFGGGEVRINKLYSSLSKYYNILLLCLNDNDRFEKKWITDTFVELSIPKTKEHKVEEKFIDSQFWVMAKDIVTSYMITKNENFMNCVKAIAPTFDLSIIIHIYMYEAIKDVNFKTLIHESLNVEYKLKQEMLSGHPLFEKLINQVEKIERGSISDSTILVSVSEGDHSGLLDYDSSKEVFTIENGVDIISDYSFNNDLTYIKDTLCGKTVVVFIGSAHIPNIDSVRFILNELSHKNDDCYFAIVGSVCECIENDKIPNNVILFGKVDDDIKNAIFSCSDIAINPMYSGSGSNLKIIDYFSWNIPTITTPFGARGFDIKDNIEAIVCEFDNFSEKIKTLQKDKELCKTLSRNAFQYVEKNLDWKILATKYKNIIDSKVLNNG